MDENIRKQFTEAKINIDEAMIRFAGRYDLMERFLKRFPEDKNFSMLVEAFEKDDAENALRASHTLKGLCGNLSMDEMRELFAEQVELLRADEYEKAKALMPEITEKYNAMIDCVKRICNM